MAFQQRHLLGISELGESEIRYLVDLAKKYKDSKNSSSDVSSKLKGKAVVNLFYESSTRTRVSFELAARKLGAVPINFSATTSSSQKGESLVDTARTVRAMNPDFIVVRHPSAGNPHLLAKILDIPIVNAGDGNHEHPSQALLDLMTMEEHIGDVRGKKVVIVGDITHSRVARSNVFALRKLGANVTLCGPKTLLPPDCQALDAQATTDFDSVLSDADVVMTLRLQFERHLVGQIPNTSEYTKFWGVTKDRAQKMKKSAIIMHPGPMNQGIEIDPEVTELTQAVVLTQVENGVFIRMAILDALSEARL